ncbi:MAG TPA: hypothetical protein VEL31_08005 [Ktedonobacteraceae bacterium]|nr:hypothetical protein [Ktedonobacteraceae bacterium]
MNASRFLLLWTQQLDGHNNLVDHSPPVKRLQDNLDNTVSTTLPQGTSTSRRLSGD